MSSPRFAHEHAATRETARFTLGDFGKRGLKSRVRLTASTSAHVIMRSGETIATGKTSSVNSCQEVDI